MKACNSRFSFGICKNALLPFFAIVLALGISPKSNAAATQTIYDDQLDNGWTNWSWATTSVAATTFVHSGTKSISIMDPAGYEALWLHPNGSINTAGYFSVTFWIYVSAPNPVPAINFVGISGSNSVSGTVSLPSAPVVGSWTKETVPLSTVNCYDIPNYSGFWLQNATGVPEPTYYIDDVTMDSDPNAVPDGKISVDASQNQHAISPQIYGVAFGGTADLGDMNLTMNRWGGNSTTGYNWQQDAQRLGNDWYFESYPQNDGTIAKSTDDFISQTLAASAQPEITLSLIGWAANLGSGRSPQWSFSQAKYGAQAAFDPYRNDAGNGVLSSTGKNVTGNNPNDANIPITPAFEKGFVDHMISKFGTSSNGGVKYYVMDNESSIWYSTHRDVHPNGPTMDEIVNDIESYGSMVKTEDPNAFIQGPEEFGWTGFFYSGADQQYGSANGWNINQLPDRAAHSGIDYMPYLLQSLKAYQTTHGTRLLDIFSLHYYPSGDAAGDQQYGSSTTSGAELLRNRSTREFWDPNYSSESWIGQPVYLIPRMKAWVNQYYPGTKVGITEYNWGDENTDYNCATTQADILGIFGREGLDVATRWVSPSAGSPMYYGMKIFRNYDGNKSSFGDTSVLDAAPNPDNMSSFAAVRSSDGAMTILVINKILSGTTPVNLNIANFTNSGIAHVWQLSSANPTIGALADVAVTSNTLSFTAPSESVTMLVIPPAAPLPTPVIAPAAGSFIGTVPVTITDSQGGVTIKYTIDGTNPATSATALTYSGQFNLSKNAVVNAVATETGFANSAEASSTYTVTPATPQIKPGVGPGKWYSAVVVTVSDVTSGSSIWYTTDGSDPASSATVKSYVGSFVIAGSTTVRAMATMTGGGPSAESSMSYVVYCASPVVKPGSGTYIGSIKVSMSDVTPGATIKYTTDGSDPLTSATALPYSLPIKLTGKTKLTTVATKLGYSSSTEVTNSYIVIP